MVFNYLCVMHSGRLMLGSNSLSSAEAFFVWNRLTIGLQYMNGIDLHMNLTWSFNWGEKRARGATGRRKKELPLQPRPQGLPRGGARAEEDPGKIRWNLQDSWRFIACAVTTTLCCWLQLALALTIFLLEIYTILFIVYVFILKVLTHFTKKYFRYKLWTHMYTNRFNIHHLIFHIARFPVYLSGNIFNIPL